MRKLHGNYSMPAAQHIHSHHLPTSGPDVPGAGENGGLDCLRPPAVEFGSVGLSCVLGPYVPFVAKAFSRPPLCP